MESVDAFLSKLQKHLVRRDEQDMLVWRKSKREFLSKKTSTFFGSGIRNFSSNCSLEPLGAEKSRILCLGSNLRENFAFETVKNKRMNVGK